jgi:hypothetical protein
MTEFGRAAGKRFPTGMVWHGRVWSSSLLGLAPMNTKTIGLTAAFILGFWTSFACAQQQAIVPHAVIANRHLNPTESRFIDRLNEVLQHGVIPGSSQTKARESALQEGR